MTYRDCWIRCDDRGLAVRCYYFPWGTKRIRYDRIRSVRRVGIGTLSGRLRIWGTSNPRYWAHLDPGRPAKREAVVLDTGRFVHPFLTPDDPDALLAELARHTSAPVLPGSARLV